MGKLKSLMFAIGITIVGIAAIFIIPFLITLGSIIGGIALVYYLREDYLKAQAINAKPELYIVKTDKKD